MNKPGISVLVPTRGRPSLLARFLASVAETVADRSAVEVVLYWDEDDSQRLHPMERRIRVVPLVGPRRSMGAYNTECLRHASGQIIILGNDDMVIRTGGWDREVLLLHERHQDGVYLGYPDDLLKGRRLCTFPILSRRSCELLVEPFPTQYYGSFIDYHVMDIFMRLRHYGFDRICFLDNVVFEHMHYRAGKGVKDATYTNRARFGDDRTFLELAPIRAAQAARLTAAVKESHIPPLISTHAEPTSLARLYRRLLTDGELPLSWRLRLLAWHMARQIYRSMITPAAS